MTSTTDLQDVDRALKARHRKMWAAGDYPAVARAVVTQLAEAVVSTAGVKTGDRVLDVAAGAGNVAIPAALTGATVVASDLTPELFDAGRQAAADADVEITWQEADAEALPFADAEFDAVLSCVGVMFAPHHQGAADELLRVCKPGGTIGLASWTPAGFIGQMFGVMKSYVAPPPPGASPPPLWGDEGYVRDLFGSRITDFVAEAKPTRVAAFGTPEEFRDFFKRCYGPTIAAYANLGDDTERAAALDADLADLARRFDIGDGAGLIMDWEYLLVTARRV